jgi:ankyrin repeat protein
MSTKDEQLIEAVKTGNLETVKQLINSGAKINAVDNAGNTPLFWAVWHNSAPIVEFLLANRPNVNKSGDKGQFPLYLAAFNDNIPIMTMLLNYKGTDSAWNPMGQNKDVDINKTTGMSNGNKTALYIACSEGLIEPVKLLIERGADINKTSGSYSPMYTAYLQKHIPIVELLQEKGAKQDSTRLVPSGEALLMESQSQQSTGSYSSSNSSSNGSRPAGQSMGQRTGFSLGSRSSGRSSGRRGRGGKRKTNKRRNAKKRRQTNKRKN